MIMVSTNFKEAVLSNVASAVGHSGPKIYFGFCRIACSSDSTNPETTLIAGVTSINVQKGAREVAV